jgi:hypothetical protein
MTIGQRANASRSRSPRRDKDPLNELAVQSTALATPLRGKVAPSRSRASGSATTTITLSPAVRRCRAKFRRYFKRGFYDPLYVDWERAYKWQAHKRWEAVLNRSAFSDLLSAGKHGEIAAKAVGIESRTNLLFSFEKMALRDAVKSSAGARAFSDGLFEVLHGTEDAETRFTQWCAVVSNLPRRQTRVLTWPVVTVFGFIAQPKTHFFLKPMVTRLAAEQYNLAFEYRSRPNWESYKSLLTFARTVSRDLRDLRPRDMIDIQSFLWVQGSDEYPD